MKFTFFFSIVSKTIKIWLYYEAVRQCYYPVYIFFTMGRVSLRFALYSWFSEKIVCFGHLASVCFLFFTRLCDRNGIPFNLQRFPLFWQCFPLSAFIFRYARGVFTATADSFTEMLLLYIKGQIWRLCKVLIDGIKSVVQCLWPHLKIETVHQRGTLIYVLLMFGLVVWGSHTPHFC